MDNDSAKVSPCEEIRQTRLAISLCLVKLKSWFWENHRQHEGSAPLAKMVLPRERELLRALLRFLEAGGAEIEAGERWVYDHASDVPGETSEAAFEAWIQSRQGQHGELDLTRATPRFAPGITDAEHERRYHSFAVELAWEAWRVLAKQELFKSQQHEKKESTIIPAAE